MRLIFMGTPDYAAQSLEAIILAGHEVLLAVTQPDKAKGRSGELMPPPVKTCALKHGIPVFQPERIKRPEAVARLREYDAEAFVVAAFGQILSQEILDLPKYGCLNVHASLLPKYRGASPIQRVAVVMQRSLTKKKPGLSTSHARNQRISGTLLRPGPMPG